MSVSRQAGRTPGVERRSRGSRKRRSAADGGECGTPARSVIVVGVTGKAVSLAEALRQSKNPRYRIIGHLAEDGIEAMPGLEVLGKLSEMFEIANRLDVDEVIVASAPGWMERLAGDISTSGDGHPKIRIVPSVYESMVCYPKMARVNDLPVMTIDCDRSAHSEWLKRVFDVGFSALALIVSAPIMALAALMMKLTSSGPVLYRQHRVGLHGTEFVLLKLRTMVRDAEKETGPVLSSANDGRVTLIGRALRRLKIDELPQFYNVLRGDMSVVGPRPERKCFVEQFSESIPGYAARHHVKPGITGPAQVYGRYTTDPEVKLKYDLMYVYGGSLFTDLKILARTIPVLIAGT